ncbi:exopolyphosphatase [Marivivens niveibacter]|uniref:Exopolyphosphatase n=1 Tax=Marivivens niveibacter TaxID=1930667 RepID=A0A251X298_9RHOB|nr:Ppx/GppA family phosphatase [Marivivens niveibacter]OUD10508.1 exopolyphosphatase [Marivivens niveibacter]
MTDTTTDDVTDWGPFGRPLFDKDLAKALARVAVLDVGSNSVRMVVFDGAARSPAYFFNEKVMAGLGAGLSETGRLNPKGRERALSAIKRFAALAESMGALPLTAVATAAAREAEDGPEFQEEVLRETGVKLHVIDGAEEARLSAQGVLLGWPGSYGLVCDIGGSSMELAVIAEGKVGNRLTSPLGPLKLRDIKGKKQLKEHIKSIVKGLHDQMGNETGKRLFLVGGSWRAIARVDMERRGYPMTVLHEYRMTSRAISTTADYIGAANLDDLRGRCSISSDRMALVPIAVQVLREVVKTFKPKDITVSSYGIREGLLYQQMPQELRDRDPLIEACRYAEAKDSRLPGFGKVMYDFVTPLFPNVSWQKKRLIKAAALLHDVSWRAHPDYRDEVAFENVTRANLGGLKHSERVFVGLSLFHRYKNKREGSRFEPLFGLLTEQEIKEAEILGKAMRLGAMLWLKDDELPGELVWKPKKRELELRLTEHAHALWGEVPASRFNSLANSLSAIDKNIEFVD